MSASDRETFERGVPVSELTYTEASQELDLIVEFFEQREVDVDQLVSRLERATAIVDELDRRIRLTRAQVEELVPRLDAVSRGAGQPHEEDRGDDGEGTDGREGTDERGGTDDLRDDEVWEDEAVAGHDLETGDHASDAAGSSAQSSTVMPERDPSGEQPLF